MKSMHVRCVVFVAVALFVLNLPAEEKESPWKKHVVYTGSINLTVVAADFTGDGKVDIIANCGGTTRLFVAPEWKQVVIDARPEHDCIHSEVLDVDGDGDPDYVGARYSPGLIFWLERPSNPLVGPWPIRVVDERVNGIHGLLVGDVDGDGRDDLLANSAQSKGPFPESLVWYRVPNKPLLAKYWYRSVFAHRDAPGLSHYLGLGDVNGDGRPDAASGAKGGPSARPMTGDWFAWWEAPPDPRAVWKKHVIRDKQRGATNIHPAEVNGDGMVDFVASRGHGEGVLWFEAPEWTMHTIHPTLKSPHCLAVTDLDLDGDVDAATCAFDDKIAAWFENDGKGKFTTHIIGRDQAAYDIRAIDMDGDVDLDLLIAGQSSKNIVWYENPKMAEIDEHLKTIDRAGPDGRGAPEAQRASAALSGVSVAVLPRLLEAMDTKNVVAGNWYRAVYEGIVSREFAKRQPGFPIDRLRGHVRDPKHRGVVRRTVLELIDRLDPEFRPALIPELLDDPEFRGDAVAAMIEAANQAKTAGDEDSARRRFLKAFTHARERGQLSQASAALEELGEDVDITKQLGYVNRWHVIGPFDAPGKTGFATVFPPEETIDLNASYEGQNGESVTWTKYQTKDPFGMVNLVDAITATKEAVGYAYTELTSKTAHKVEMRCGADDNCSVWLNGERIFGREQWLNGTRPDRFRAPAIMRAGKNTVLVKICQGPQHKNPSVGNNWTFELRFCDETGAGIEFDLAPVALKQ